MVFEILNMEVLIIGLTGAPQGKQDFDPFESEVAQNGGLVLPVGSGIVIEGASPAREEPTGKSPIAKGATQTAITDTTNRNGFTFAARAGNRNTAGELSQGLRRVEGRGGSVGGAESDDDFRGEAGAKTWKRINPGLGGENLVEDGLNFLFVTRQGSHLNRELLNQTTQTKSSGSDDDRVGLQCWAVDLVEQGWDTVRTAVAVLFEKSDKVRLWGRQQRLWIWKSGEKSQGNLVFNLGKQPHRLRIVIFQTGRELIHHACFFIHHFPNITA